MGVRVDERGSHAAWTRVLETNGDKGTTLAGFERRNRSRCNGREEGEGDENGEVHFELHYGSVVVWSDVGSGCSIRLL